MPAGYPDLTLEFDLTSIEALQEDENKRVSREVQLLDRGVRGEAPIASVQSRALENAALSTMVEQVYDRWQGNG